MNSFNITRFGQTLRWVIAVNYRTMLLWTTGIALITFVAELYILKMSHIPLDLMQSSFGFGIFVMMTAFAFLASYVTSFINEKRRRLAFLALPATNSEKFLSLITYTSIIWLCEIFLALVAGDSLRMLFCWIKHFYEAPLPDHDADSWHLLRREGLEGGTSGFASNLPRYGYMCHSADLVYRSCAGGIAFHFWCG